MTQAEALANAVSKFGASANFSLFVLCSCHLGLCLS